MVYAIHPTPHSVKSKVTIQDYSIQTGTIYYKLFYLTIGREIKPRNGAIKSVISLLINIKEFTIDGQKLNAEIQCLFCDPYLRIKDIYANGNIEEEHHAAVSAETVCDMLEEVTFTYSLQELSILAIRKQLGMANKFSSMRLPLPHNLQKAIQCPHHCMLLLLETFHILLIEIIYI